MILAALILQQLGTPIPWAFSHNDYTHKRPLLDALEQGFAHVEADVFLVDGKLLVAHDRPDVRPDKSLDALYLKPIFDLWTKNHGSVYPGMKQPFWLMIDIKENGPAVYDELKKELEPYSKMLCSWTDKGRGKGAVAIVLSGERPTDVVAKEKRRWVAIDGRPSDLESNPPAGLVPWVSVAWPDLFKWDGKSAPTPELRASVTAYVNKAHTQKREVRFWAIPDNPLSWQFQREVGIDMVNTNNLAGLAQAAH